MALQPSDYFVVNRATVDYKYEYSALLADLNVDLNIDLDLNDGKIQFNAGDGLAEVGDNATANQETDTLKTFSVKTGSGITIDANGNVIIDPNFDLSGNITFGDGAIEFNAGDGLAETGTNATANQTGDTAKTFSVKTGSGIIIDGNGNVIIDPSFNLDGNITAPGDGAINVDAGLGLEATGPNATANQTTATTRILSAKTAGGITIDGNGNIIIDPSFNLDGNITPPGDGKITINSYDGSLVGEFTVNQDGNATIVLPEVVVPEALHPSGFIDVSQPAPTAPEHGDIYIQHRNDLADVVADSSFAGIAGRTITDGQFVMFGVDDLWHAGGDAAPTEHQSDWAQTNAAAIDYIKNKPDIPAIVDAEAGDGAINVDAGPGIEATGSNATANQKTATTRTLSVKTASGITIDANGNVIIDPNFNLDGNVTAPNDGVLTVKDHTGATVGTFTANQAGNTDVTLPEGFSGDYNDLNNLPTIPTVNDGKLTIKDEDDNVLGEFTANQAGDTEVVIPGGGDGLDCAGVVDCFNNAPIDPARVSIAVNVLEDFFEDPADEPDHWPEGQDHSVYMYADICDPVSHEIIPFVPREEHGHAAVSGSILRLPYGYYRPTYCVITPSPPVTRLEDAKELYGAHPDTLAIPDLKLFRGKYIKGVTTTDDLWNTGTAMADFLTDSQTVKLDLPRCDSYTMEETKDGGEWWGCDNYDDMANDGMYFFRFEFAWKQVGAFNLVLLMNHDRQQINITGDTGGPTTIFNEEMPNIQIKPMEDN